MLRVVCKAGIYFRGHHMAQKCPPNTLIPVCVTSVSERFIYQPIRYTCSMKYNGPAHTVHNLSPNVKMQIA